MLQRIINVLRAYIRQFISGVRDDDPERLLARQQENLRKQMALLHQALVARAGASEKLLSITKRLQGEEELLKSSAANFLQSGRQREAAETALRLQRVRQDLEQAQKQWQESESHYKELVVVRDTAIKASNEKMQELRKDLDELRMKNSLADACLRAGNVATEIGGNTISLEKIHDQIKSEIAKADGRSWAAHDTLLPADFSEQQKQREEQEDLALAVLALELGLPIAANQAAEEKTLNTATTPTMIQSS